MKNNYKTKSITGCFCSGLLAVINTSEEHIIYSDVDATNSVFVADIYGDFDMSAYGGLYRGWRE